MNRNLIPLPASIMATEGEFRITAQTVIAAYRPETAVIAAQLAEMIKSITGLELSVVEGDTDSNVIRLSDAGGGDLGVEGYRLTVTSQHISIEAAQFAGVFYGVQTLRQLLPLTGEAVIGACSITDQPRFAYRGAMLDVSRHFFSIADIKRVIDLIALYKMNKMHLHLTDDQGWRIEILSWPNLTAHGSTTQVGGGAGGYYTQADYAEIVAYAQARYVEIVPEIDMPGHTNAALSSYPDLNPDGVDAPALYSGTEVGFSTLTINKELTYAFLDDVVREVAALTPGQYFHIGGDESHATPPEDYQVFLARIQHIVKSHGKKLIGWEEIGQTELLPGTVVQHWFSDFSRKAVVQGGKVICSPASRAYMDMKYDESSPLGLTWAGTANTHQSYEWEPGTLMEGVSESDIIGVEAPLWSETILTVRDIEFMMFPRLLGIAEIGWSPAAGRSWEEYRVRLAVHGARLSALGVNFYRDPLVDWA